MRRCIRGSGNGLILVEGEEDLALLPCILYAPEGAEIVYGWPGRCMMLVRVDGQTQMKAAELVARLEEKK